MDSSFAFIGLRMTICANPVYYTLNRRSNITGNAFSDLHDAVYRTYRDTCRFVVEANTVGADRFIDDINVFSRRDSGYRAFGFASPAVSARIENSVCHDTFLRITVIICRLFYMILPSVKYLKNMISGSKVPKQAVFLFLLIFTPYCRPC